MLKGASGKREWLARLPTDQQRRAYWKLLGHTQFEVRLDGLIVAMEQVIAAWPAEDTEDTCDGKVVGTVSPGQRARWGERFGEQLADVRQLWRQIDYQMTSGEEFAGTVVDASVLETAQQS
jgi:hypothetical protein